jgi:hypothetical protein
MAKTTVKHKQRDYIVGAGQKGTLQQNNNRLYNIY